MCPNASVSPNRTCNAVRCCMSCPSNTSPLAETHPSMRLVRPGDHLKRGSHRPELSIAESSREMLPDAAQMGLRGLAHSLETLLRELGLNHSRVGIVTPSLHQPILDQTVYHPRQP